ncbi:MAG: hypothetical protein LBK50_02375 [Candidatus Nomurabacteria bacterium]|jgi:hypothetical protein|nr:hypothetical protein [Candidatus Nomurabacteria bacterium]
MSARKTRRITQRIEQNLTDFAAGFKLVFRRWQYVVTAVIVFLVFTFILELFSSGTGELKLLFAGISLGEKAQIMANIFLRSIGLAGEFSLEAFLAILISALQGVIGGFLAFVIHEKRTRPKTCKVNLAKDAENASIGAIAAVAGAGCASCGTSIIAPLFAALFSSSGYVLSVVFGWLMNIVAVVIAVLVMINLGKESLKYGK